MSYESRLLFDDAGQAELRLTVSCQTSPDGSLTAFLGSPAHVQVVKSSYILNLVRGSMPYVDIHAAIEYRQIHDLIDVVMKRGYWPTRKPRCLWQQRDPFNGQYIPWTWDDAGDNTIVEGSIVDAF